MDVHEGEVYVWSGSARGEGKGRCRRQGCAARTRGVCAPSKVKLISSSRHLSRTDILNSPRVEADTPLLISTYNADLIICRYDHPQGPETSGASRSAPRSQIIQSGPNYLMSDLD